ncbi:MAG: peptide chain release factor 1, partial [Lentimonas sp.]
MSFSEKLNSIITRYEDLSQKVLDPAKLGDNYAKVSKEYSDLGPIVKTITEFQATQKEVHDLTESLKEEGLDQEM